MDGALDNNVGKRLLTGIHANRRRGRAREQDRDRHSFGKDLKTWVIDSSNERQVSRIQLLLPVSDCSRCSTAAVGFCATTTKYHLIDHMPRKWKLF